MNQYDLSLILDSGHLMEDVINKIEQYEIFKNEQTDIDLFGLFQIDMDNYIKIKFAFMYHMQIPPEQVDNWPYWEYETYIEMLSDILKKKQEAEKNQGSQSSSTMTNPSHEAAKMMRTVKMPNMPKFK